MGGYERRLWDEMRGVSLPDAPGAPVGALPYEAYVPHKLAQWMPSFTSSVSNRLIAAERILNRWNDYSRHKSQLPAEWLIRRAESAASSTIEGVHPSARRLARAEAQLSLFGDTPNRSDMEALRNVFAVEKALAVGDEHRPITVMDVRDIHAVLMGDEDPRAGQMRTTQNWIGGGYLSSPVTASFVPPPADNVPELMEDLIRCINRPAGSPVMQAALVHSQFETIHPFGDGNGRTGRALIQLMLQRSSDGRCPPPVSSSLALQRDAYIGALDATHEACPEMDRRRSDSVSQWVGLFSDSVGDATNLAFRIAEHVDVLLGRWRHQVLAAKMRGSSSSMRLVEFLPSNPALTAAKAADLLGVRHNTAMRALTSLEKCGVLVQRSAGKRNRIYQAEMLMDAFSKLSSAEPLSTALSPLSDVASTKIGDVSEHVCGRWMPRAKAYCALRPKHKGGCRRKPS